MRAGVDFVGPTPSTTPPPLSRQLARQQPCAVRALGGACAFCHTFPRRPAAAAAATVPNLLVYSPPKHTHTIHPTLHITCHVFFWRRGRRHSIESPPWPLFCVSLRFRAPPPHPFCTLPPTRYCSGAHTHALHTRTHHAGDLCMENWPPPEKII